MYRIPKKLHFISCLFLSLITSLVIPIVSPAQANPRYNILFIIMDDMSQKSAVFGYPEVLTPNLQRIAQRGVVFKRAYCQFPLCNPSRTSLLSGWRPDKTGVFDNRTRPRSVMGQEVKFLPEYFSLYGYHTERVGKVMHGTYQNEIAWDYSDPTNANDQSKDSDPGSWWVTNLPDDSTINGVYAGIMIQRMQLLPPQPFFLALGLTVHSPFTPSLKYWNMYGDPSVQQLLPINKEGGTGNLVGNGSGNIKLPATPPGDRNDVPPIAFPVQVQKTTEEWQNAVHAYYAEVTEMDAQLGLVLDEMDRQNLWQNTVVVFCGDHGVHLGEHEGAWAKNTLFEESGLVPLIVSVPGNAPGTSNALVESVDLYPTLAEICSLPPPSGIEGSSFVRLLENTRTPWKRAVFTQVRRDTLKARSAITKQYRYNSWGTFGEELYDHATDPFEYTNLAANPAYLSVLIRMRKILAQGWTRSLPPAGNSRSEVIADYTNKTPNKLAPEIKVFPNPSSGNIVVAFNSKQAGNVLVTVYDNTGKVVFSATKIINEGNVMMPLQLAGLAAGLYSMELKNKVIHQQVKLLIEK